MSAEYLGLLEKAPLCLDYAIGSAVNEKDQVLRGVAKVGPSVNVGLV